ncbi:MAG: DUF502 domain-containing protein [Verrucomicrobiota bacterium]
MNTAQKTNKSFFARFQANFFTGLAIVLPGALSIALVVWVFRNIANVTDALLLFMPKHWTHQDGGQGPFYWYSSLLALAMAVVLITIIGRLAREYLGQKAIKYMEDLMLRVPLVNKVYSTIKQVNEAFTGNKTAFKQVCLLEYPRTGVYSVGFITSEQLKPIVKDNRQHLVSVFIPTTPNPTSGFIVLVPEAEVTKLDISVADGIKFIISLGALTPDQQQTQVDQLKPDA